MIDAMKIAALIVRIGGSGMDIGISRDELRKRLLDLANEGIAKGSLPMSYIKEKFSDTIVPQNMYGEIKKTFGTLGITIVDGVDLLDKYVARMKDERKLDTTIYAVTTALNKLNNFMLTKYGVNILTEDVKNASGHMINAWDEDKRERGLKESSRNTEINAVRPYFRFVYSLGYTDRNLGDALPHIAQRNFDPDHLLNTNNEHNDKVYTSEEIQRMISVALDNKNKVKALRDAAIIATLAASGLRSAELRGIPYGQIKKMGDDGIIVVRRKGGVYATVAIAKFAHPYIKAYMKVRPETDDDVGFFLNGWTPKNMAGVRNLNHILTPIQEKAGVKTGVHTFRHTVVTNISREHESGIAAMIAGHKTDAVTRRHYIHPSNEDKTKYINQLDYGEDLDLLSCNTSNYNSDSLDIDSDDLDNFEFTSNDLYDFESDQFDSDQ